MLQAGRNRLDQLGGGAFHKASADLFEQDVSVRLIPRGHCQQQIKTCWRGQPFEVWDAKQRLDALWIIGQAGQQCRLGLRIAQFGKR